MVRDIVGFCVKHLAGAGGGTAADRERYGELCERYPDDQWAELRQFCERHARFDVVPHREFVE
jgi:hypothetical protein